MEVGIYVMVMGGSSACISSRHGLAFWTHILFSSPSLSVICPGRGSTECYSPFLEALTTLPPCPALEARPCPHADHTVLTVLGRSSQTSTQPCHLPPAHSHDEAGNNQVRTWSPGEWTRDMTGRNEDGRDWEQKGAKRLG